MLKVRTDELGESYLLKSKFSEDGYRIVFTQLINNSLHDCTGWAQDCTMEDFPIFLQTYNPLIEAGSPAILNKLKKSLLDEKTAMKISGDVNSEERTVQISAPLSEESPTLRLAWKFECSRISPQAFCSEFLQPLLSTSVLLSYENQLLISIIERKDTEIAEHRSNGSIIKRAHLETRPFEEKNFQSEILKTMTVVDLLTEPAPRMNQYGLSSKLSGISEILDQHNVDGSSSLEQRSGGRDQNEEMVSTSPSNKLPTPSKNVSPLKRTQEVNDDKFEKELEEERRAEIARLQSQPPPQTKKKKKLF